MKDIFKVHLCARFFLRPSPLPCSASSAPGGVNDDSLTETSSLHYEHAQQNRFLRYSDYFRRHETWCYTTKNEFRLRSPPLSTWIETLDVTLLFHQIVEFCSILFAFRCCMFHFVPRLLSSSTSWYCPSSLAGSCPRKGCGETPPNTAKLSIANFQRVSTHESTQARYLHASISSRDFPLVSLMKKNTKTTNA